MEEVRPISASPRARPESRARRGFQEHLLLRCLMTQRESLGRVTEASWSPDTHFEGEFHFQWVSASEAWSVPTPLLRVGLVLPEGRVTYPLT